MRFRLKMHFIKSRMVQTLPNYSCAQQMTMRRFKTFMQILVHTLSVPSCTFYPFLAHCTCTQYYYYLLHFNVFLYITQFFWIFCYKQQLREIFFFLYDLKIYDTFQVRWFKENNELKSTNRIQIESKESSHRHTLKLMGLASPQDFGNYSCVAENSLGSSK